MGGLGPGGGWLRAAAVGCWLAADAVGQAAMEGLVVNEP